MLGLRFCARAFSSCSERGPLFIAVRGPLTIAASLVAEHRLQTRWLSSCGSRAQLLRGMWDPPRPGLEPVSPGLAGRLSTTAPPGKPRCSFCLLEVNWDSWMCRGEGKNEENYMTLRRWLHPSCSPIFQLYSKCKELGMLREKNQWFLCVMRWLALGRENTRAIYPFSATDALI